MEQLQENLEDLWDALLSREVHLIREAFYRLETEEQQAVLSHLKRMTMEKGWHPEQVASAQAALDALKENQVSSSD